jgi:hypothetical protein
MVTSCSCARASGAAMINAIATAMPHRPIILVVPSLVRRPPA